MSKENKKDQKRPGYRSAGLSQKKIKRVPEVELYDNADMMRILKVCGRTLQRWRQEKILPFTKLGGRIYYLKSDLHELLRRQIR